MPVASPTADVDHRRADCGDLADEIESFAMP